VELACFFLFMPKNPKKSCFSGLNRLFQRVCVNRFVSRSIRFAFSANLSSGENSYCYFVHLAIAINAVLIKIEKYFISGVSNLRPAGHYVLCAESFRGAREIIFSKSKTSRYRYKIRAKRHFSIKMSSQSLLNGENIKWSMLRHQLSQ